MDADFKRDCDMLFEDILSVAPDTEDVKNTLPIYRRMYANAFDPETVAYDYSDEELDTLDLGYYGDTTPEWCENMSPLAALINLVSSITEKDVDLIRYWHRNRDRFFQDKNQERLKRNGATERTMRFWSRVFNLRVSWLTQEGHL